MDAFRNKLNSILEHYEKVREQLNDPSDFDQKEYAKLSKEFSDLGDISKEIRLLFSKQNELKETTELAESSSDKEIKAMAEEEIPHLKASIEEIENQIKILLLPKDIDDEKGAILEIRAGTGGDEAGLFAADLFRMYEMYAAIHGWKFEVLEFSESGIGAIKEASASISGKGVFARLKFESGVHRVQRVPETESSGRIHTSAATVAVLPEAEEVDVQIDEKDLQIDTYRSSGAGGQHVNKTDSAVRITRCLIKISISLTDTTNFIYSVICAVNVRNSRCIERSWLPFTTEPRASHKG